MDNSVPLCGWHHRRVHDTAYRVRYLPTGEVRIRRIWKKPPASQTTPTAA